MKKGVLRDEETSAQRHEGQMDTHENGNSWGHVEEREGVAFWVGVKGDSLVGDCDDGAEKDEDDGAGEGEDGDEDGDGDESDEGEVKPYLNVCGYGWLDLEGFQKRKHVKGEE